MIDSEKNLLCLVSGSVIGSIDDQKSPRTVFALTSSHHRMRNIGVYLITFSISALAADAQIFIPTDNGSGINFRIKNFGTTVEGCFKGITGRILFDPNVLSTAKFDVSVEANSIDTGIKMRDYHLRKEEYLDTRIYDRIRFVSSRVSKSSAPNEFIITGVLTIKNVAKQIAFPFFYSISGGAPVFHGQFEIDRRDFNVGGNSLIMSDKVTVHVSLSTVKKIE